MKAKKDKPVICETTLTAYLNISLASQATGCSRDGISRVCDGKQVSVKDKHGNKLDSVYRKQLE